MDKQKCTGCGVCALKCPTHAICMKMDEEGFLYPNRETDKCISCGLCDKVCHLNVKREDTATPISVYAATNIDENMLLESSSGGVFGAIAENILSHQGVCYGVSLDNFEAKYLRVQDKADLRRLFGSKYVQADIGNTYELVEKDCLDGREVLFVGTPCLVSGLKSFLRKDYRNLYTIDIVCHGAPSSLYFKGYIEFLKSRLKCRIISFRFRDKSKYGLGCISSCEVQKNNSRKKLVLTNQLLNYYYYYMFADSYRESCYQCRYTNINRVSDITLGDFWGIEKFNTTLDVKHGCSAVIINTIKGEVLFNEIISLKCRLEKRTIDEVLIRNSALKSNIHRPSTRDSVYKELSSNSFIYMVHGRYRPSFSQYIKGVAKGILPTPIQNLIYRHK